MTDGVVTTSSPDQPWITGQTETTNRPTDDDNEDKSTTGAGATTEIPQSTTLQFTEGEISSANQDVETEKFFIDEITTSSPEEEVTLGGWKEIPSTTLALSDLIRGTGSPAEPSQPGDDVTTAGETEMINDVTTSQDDIADEVGGASTISSGEETTSEPELITQNYKIVFAPSTEPTISNTERDTTTNSASTSAGAEQTTTEPDTTETTETTTAIRTTDSVTTTEETETTTVTTTCPGSVECEGVCLARYQVCDGLAHCGGGEDETDCSDRPCLPSEFSCGGGRCIPSSWLCDGRPDCPAGEDEVSCSSSCSPGEVRCGESGQCVGRARLCDGVQDCREGEDEADCQCQPGELRCSWGGGCVPAEARCDGQWDCGDRSDEWNCVQLSNSTLTIASLSAGPRPVCSDQWSQEWSEQTCRQLGYLGPANSSTSYDFNLVDSDFW